MGNPVSSRVPLEFIAGKGFHETQTSRTSRAVLPSFAQQFGGATHSVVAMENVSVNVAVPSLAAGHSATLTAYQGFQEINSVNPSTSDLGKAIFSNVSVAPPPNILPGHPTIQIVAQQGAPDGGDLQPGLKYTKLALSVGLTVYAMTAATAGTAVVSATILLMGTESTNNS